MILNSEQIATLWEHAQRQAQAFMRRLRPCGRFDVDDVAQELFLRVWQRAHQFNAARAKWEAFCAMIVAQGICNLWRHHCAPQRWPAPARTLSLTTHSEPPDHHAAEEGAPHNLWELEHDVGILLARLFDDERQVAEHLKEHSWRAAEQACQLSRSRLRTIANKFRRLAADLDLFDV